MEHHPGSLVDPGHPVGNGVAVRFEVDDFEAVAGRAHDLGVRIELDGHVNPNANHREIWLRDPDGYLVVVAER